MHGAQTTAAGAEQPGRLMEQASRVKAMTARVKAIKDSGGASHETESQCPKRPGLRPHIPVGGANHNLRSLRIISGVPSDAAKMSRSSPRTTLMIDRIKPAVARPLPC